MKLVRVLTIVGVLGAVLSTASSPSGAQLPSCFGRVATIVAQPGVPTVGTSGSDVIVGTSGDDVIRGRGGADYICAKGGDDRVWGNAGRDRINLGPGDDWAKGGKGDDRIWGKKGRDIAWGNGGEDWLNGGSGFDMLMGGKKADEVLGKSGADALEGNSGPDDLRGGKGIDACDGGTGTDTVSSCNERVPFGPNPFVGWWMNDDWRGAGWVMTIDPSGREVGHIPDSGFCADLGFVDPELEYVALGAQSGPTTFLGAIRGGQSTCSPRTLPETFSYDASTSEWRYTIDAATDTLIFNETCFWRRGSSPSDCD